MPGFFNPLWATPDVAGLTLGRALRGGDAEALADGGGVAEDKSNGGDVGCWRMSEGKRDWEGSPAYP